MSEKEPKWKGLKRWPKTAEARLGLPEGTEEFCRYLFENARFRIQVITLAEGEREIRIPASYGELFPVSRERWGWIGPGGYWSKKVIKLLGGDAFWPGGDTNATTKDAGTRFDESQIDFPKERLLEMAKLVKARKRQPPNSGASNLRPGNPGRASP